MRSIISVISLVAGLLLVPASPAQTPPYPALCSGSAKAFRITPEQAERIADLRRLFGDSSEFPDIASAEGKFIECPRALKHAYPPYPAALRKKNHEGRVTVVMITSESGTVLDVRIVDSSNTVFNDLALSAARTMMFTPAQIDGVPVRFFSWIVFQWRLRE